MKFREIPRLIRTSEWWTGKLPFQLGFIFYLLYADTSNRTLYELLPSILAWFGAFLAIASFGYFINDYFDQTEDARAGKTNRVANLSQQARVFWVLFLSIANILPWLYLGVSPTLAYLLAAQFIAFLLYSIPPIRLKRVPYVGMLLDALYAYLIPSLITLAVFSPLLNVSFNSAIKYAFGAWIVLVGFRNIVLHHLADAEHDRHNTAFVFNWTQRRTAAQIQRLFQRIFLPLENLSFLILLYFLPKGKWILIGLWVIFLLITQIAPKRDSSFFAKLHQQAPIVRFNVFYESWLAFVLLGLCLPLHWSSLLIIIGYLALFQIELFNRILLWRFPIYHALHDFYYWLLKLGYRLSRLPHYISIGLYYIFVFFPIKIVERIAPKLYQKLRTHYRKRKNE